jgi:hypothetical protein
VKGERDGRDNGAAKVQDLPQRSERTPRPGKRESSQVGVQEVPRATASGRPETHRQDQPDTEPVKLCAACETACVISKGFWACPDVTCGRYGQQQGRVQ